MRNANMPNDPNLPGGRAAQMTGQAIEQTGSPEDKMLEVYHSASKYLNHLASQLANPEIQQQLIGFGLENQEYAQALMTTLDQLNQLLVAPESDMGGEQMGGEQMMGMEQSMQPGVEQSGMGGGVPFGHDVSHFEQMDESTRDQMYGPGFAQQFERFRSGQMEHPEMVQFLQENGFGQGQ